MGTRHPLDRGPRPGAAAIVGAAIVIASCGTPSTDRPPAATTTITGTGSPTALATSTTVPSALLERAARPGGLPVVVTLDVPFQPEADLGGDEAVARQRQAIADTQSRLQHELAPYAARVTSRFRSTPQLALVVDEAALRHLLASPLVAGVQEDAASPPAGPN